MLHLIEQNNKTPNNFAILCYLAICIIWGTTYYAISLALQHGIPPFMLGVLRFFLAGFLIVFIGFFKQQLVFKAEIILPNLLIGALMMGGGQGLIFWAQQHIASGYASIIEASLPLWFVLLDNHERKNYLNNNKIITGLVIGFIGILLLFITQLMPGSFHNNMAFLGVVASFLSCICWVVASLHYKKRFPATPLMATIGWQLFGGMICCLLLSILTKEIAGFSISKIVTNAWICVFYLAVAGSVVAFMAYQYLLRHWAPAIVGTYAYINPLIAVLIGHFVAAEIVNVYQLAGMMTILAAAYLINKGRQDLS